MKQVAVLGDEVEFTEDERDVDPDYLDFALNEWDTYATEEALRLVEAAGSGEVVVVSVGDEDAEDAMRRCLAMGADRGIRVEAEERLDPIQVARALAEVVQGESADLVFAGVQSSDSVQAATGGALAGLLDMPSVAVVTKIELGDGKATVNRELEGGLVDVVEVDTPAAPHHPDRDQRAALRDAPGDQAGGGEGDRRSAGRRSRRAGLPCPQDVRAPRRAKARRC